MTESENNSDQYEGSRSETFKIHIIRLINFNFSNWDRTIRDVKKMLNVMLSV